MHFLSDYQESLCALQVIAEMLCRAARYQVLTHMLGDYAELPVFGVLIQLQGLARCGICPMTRVLEDNEMPSLTRLLDRLPDDARAYLETSFAAEKAGLCVHGPRARMMDSEDSAIQADLTPLVLSSHSMPPELLEFERDFMWRYATVKRPLVPGDLEPRHSPPLLLRPDLALPLETLTARSGSGSGSGSRWSLGPIAQAQTQAQREARAANEP
jgi:hypothetical protein